MKELNYLIQLLLETEKDGELESHGRTMKRLKEEDLSSLDVVKLALAADRMENIGKYIYGQVKEQAAEQLELMYEEKKNEVLGNQVTVQTRETYEYPDDDPILRDYKEHIENINEKIKKYKDEQKPYKDGIKSRQEQLKIDGKAKLKGVTKYISISRK